MDEDSENNTSDDVVRVNIRLSPEMAEKIDKRLADRSEWRGQPPRKMSRPALFMALVERWLEEGNGHDAVA